MSDAALRFSDRAQTVIRLRKPTMDDPWAWLSAGWTDLARNPLLSLVYGGAFVALGLLITIGLWSVGLESVVPALAGGFALVGPVFAVGLYEMSRRYEQGETVGLKDILAVRLPAPAQMAFLAFALMFLLLGQRYIVKGLTSGAVK